VLKTLLYMFGVMSLVCAGIVFYFSAEKWSQFAVNNEPIPKESIIEKFKQLDNLQAQNDKEVVSPLVKQSGEYALIINPPAPPKPKEEPKELIKPREFQLPRTSPKFKILATSCNRTRPEDSIALISEPGRGEHWVKVGDPIGRFVLEKIEHGSIIYRYGNQSSEMAVETKPPVRIAQERKP